MGRRLMKSQHLKEEIEKTIEDKLERSKILGGTIGDIFNSTQVNSKQSFNKILAFSPLILLSTVSPNEHAIWVCAQICRRQLWYHLMLLLQ